MNFIDKIKIKNNPNVIDFWNEKKINQEVIECAIRSGYKFNLSNKRLFDKYAVYINTFKYEPGYLQDEIKKVRENLTLELLFTTYGREAAIKIIKQDIELTKFVLKEHIFGLQETEIIQIIDENDELINLAIKNYLGLSNSSNKELAKYIANKKTPHELKEMGIKIRDLDKAFIETADPEKIKEMLYNGQDYLGIEDLYDIRKVIKENLEKFIFYIKEFKEIKTSIIQNDIWLDYIKYLKDNEIVYNDKLDRDVLYNREYLLMCLKLCPTIAEDSMVSYMIVASCLKLEEYPDYISEIAEKIIKEQIKFQEIPSCYQKCREIYENIIKVNPELLENANNRVGLKIITADMSDEEKLDYYRSIGHPFNANVVICNKELESNFLVVLECLKKDHMTLANSEKEYTLEQYKEIYEVLKNDITPEEVLANKFLIRNPYFVIDLLNRDELDLNVVDLSETREYERVYPKIKAISIKKGIEVPEPKEYNGNIRFEGNEVFFELQELNSVKNGLEFLRENGLQQDLNILMNSENCEFVISDNIEFFEELAKNGININFRYSGSKKIFSLQEILRMEHFMQRVVEEIKSKNYSPLEQLIAIYDISKYFKKYKEAEGPLSRASRVLYEYLDNDEYMVCVGYADLVVNLGHRLNLQCTEIGLKTQNEGHSRNYVYIKDDKYNIDGFFALDPTWDNNVDNNSGRLKETDKSTYKYFLMTTEEGRKGVSLNIDEYGGYDCLVTMKTPEEVRQYIFKNKDWYKRISILDPEFYKRMITLDFSKDDDINILINYFKTKINTTVSKEMILDAIIEVKKSIYANLTEQDYEDMRMAYSMTEPFCIKEGHEKIQSLYGNQYYEYVNKRYEELKLKTIKEIQNENLEFDVSYIYRSKDE